LCAYLRGILVGVEAGKQVDFPAVEPHYGADAVFRQPGLVDQTQVLQMYPNAGLGAAPSGWK